jgi:hypothetical protein
MIQKHDYSPNPEEIRMPEGWWIPVGLFCAMLFATGLYVGAAVF